MDIFEKASKRKLRFITSAGNLSVEDLWDLPLTNSSASLNNVAKAVNKNLKSSVEEDFVEDKPEPNILDTLRLDILKRIIEVRKANIEKAEKAAETKARNQRILALLDEKADDKLKGKSEAALRKMLEE